MTLTSAELALAAERRTWRMILDADTQLPGLPPSIVLSAAHARVNRLDELLIGLAPHEIEEALSAGTPDVDDAYVRAATEMSATLRLISDDLDNATRGT